MRIQEVRGCNYCPVRVQCTKCSETSDDGRLRVVDIVLVVLSEESQLLVRTWILSVLMKHMLCWAHNCARVILLFEFLGLLQSNGTEMSTKNTKILATDPYNLTFRLQLHSYKVVWVNV